LAGSSLQSQAPAAMLVNRVTPTKPAKLITQWALCLHRATRALTCINPTNKQNLEEIHQQARISTDCHCLRWSPYLECSLSRAYLQQLLLPSRWPGYYTRRRSAILSFSLVVLIHIAWHLTIYPSISIYIWKRNSINSQCSSCLSALRSFIKYAHSPCFK
jgi:hypothetical protein